MITEDYEDDHQDELDDAAVEFIENLIFECAIDSGIKTDGTNFYVGHTGEYDITPELWKFTALMAAKMRVLMDGMKAQNGELQ